MFWPLRDVYFLCFIYLFIWKGHCISVTLVHRTWATMLQLAPVLICIPCALQATFRKYNKQESAQNQTNMSNNMFMCRMWNKHMCWSRTRLNVHMYLKRETPGESPAASSGSSHQLRSMCALYKHTTTKTTTIQYNLNNTHWYVTIGTSAAPWLQFWFVLRQFWIGSDCGICRTFPHFRWCSVPDVAAFYW